jgi:rhamnulokinase
LSTSQLYDPVSKDWAWDIINGFGLRKQLFGSIIPSGTLLGPLSEEILHETGLIKADVYAVTGHDTACAVVSVPSQVMESTIYLSSGTWSLMGIESYKPYINKRSYESNLSNEIGYGGTYRVLMNIVGLWIYQECRREWQKGSDALSFDDLEAEAEKCRPFISFIDPDDHIFFEPGGMPGKIRQYCSNTGQEVPVSRAEIVSVILQSLAMKYRQVSKTLDGLADREHKTINIIGGGCRNRLLSQFTADATGKTVHAGPTEATSIGNILVQLMAMGEIKDLNQAREITGRSFGITSYEPHDTGSWDSAYERFMRITYK